MLTKKVLMGLAEAVCNSRPGHLWLYCHCVGTMFKCGYYVCKIDLSL